MMCNVVRIKPVCCLSGYCDDGGGEVWASRGASLRQGSASDCEIDCMANSKDGCGMKTQWRVESTML